MRTAALWVVLLALACDDRPEGTEPSAPAEDPMRALYAPRWHDDESMVLDPDPPLGDRAALERLQADLERATRGAADLDVGAAIVLQNDVWGLWKRLRRGGAPVEVIASAEGLMEALARDPDAIASVRGQPHLAKLDASLGWTEVGTEHAVLQHEAAHGMRRVARLYRAGDEHRALGTHLVALARDGQPHVTSIPGELEVLHFASSGPPVAAEVFDLDRARLELTPVSVVEHLPAAGADTFFATFEPPSKLEAVPCRECHRDAFMMSLPDPDAPVDTRLLDVALIAERPGVD